MSAMILVNKKHKFYHDIRNLITSPENIQYLSITRHLPTLAFSEYTNLIELEIYQCEAFPLRGELYRFPSLKTLKIVDTPLLQCPELPVIETLHWKNTNLIQWPMTIDSSHIIELNVSGNKLSEFSLTSFPLLRKLDLSNNRLSHINIFPKLLEFVNLSWNCFSISDISFTHHDLLRHVDMSHNRFTDMFEMNLVPSVVYLNISFNSISHLVHHAPNIVYLNANHNALTEWNDVSCGPNLKHLYLSQNRLQGTFTSTLPALTRLDLSYNPIEFLTIAPLSELEFLDLRQTRISSSSSELIPCKTIMVDDVRSSSSSTYAEFPPKNDTWKETVLLQHNSEQRHEFNSAFRDDAHIQKTIEYLQTGTIPSNIHNISKFVERAKRFEIVRWFVHEHIQYTASFTTFTLQEIIQCRFPLSQLIRGHRETWTSSTKKKHQEYWMIQKRDRLRIGYLNEDTQKWIYVTNDTLVSENQLYTIQVHSHGDLFLNDQRIVLNPSNFAIMVGETSFFDRDSIYYNFYEYPSPMEEKDVLLRLMCTTWTDDTTECLYRNPRFPLYVISSKYVFTMMEEFYEEYLFHLGIGEQKFYEKICEYCIGITREMVNRFLQTKLASTVKGSLTKRNIINKPIIAHNVDERWVMDLLTFPQEIASKNHQVKYLLCVIDYFSKYVWIRPLKKKNVESITPALEDILKDAKLLDFVLYERNDEEPDDVKLLVQSDNASEFKTPSLLQLFHGIRQIFSTTYKPTTNGIIENFVHNLRKKILHYIESVGSASHLTEFVDQFALSWNETPHGTIKYKPIYVRNLDRRSDEYKKVQRDIESSLLNRTRKLVARNTTPELKVHTWVYAKLRCLSSYYRRYLKENKDKPIYIQWFPRKFRISAIVNEDRALRLGLQKCEYLLEYPVNNIYYPVVTENALRYGYYEKKHSQHFFATDLKECGDTGDSSPSITDSHDIAKWIYRYGLINGVDAFMQQSPTMDGRYADLYEILVNLIQKDRLIRMLRHPDQYRAPPAEEAPRPEKETYEAMLRRVVMPHKESILKLIEERRQLPENDPSQQRIDEELRTTYLKPLNWGPIFWTRKMDNLYAFLTTLDGTNE